jgi:hypothetical protein
MVELHGVGVAVEARDDPRVAGASDDERDHRAEVKEHANYGGRGVAVVCTEVRLAVKNVVGYELRLQASSKPKNVMTYTVPKVTRHGNEIKDIVTHRFS